MFWTDGGTTSGIMNRAKKMVLVWRAGLVLVLSVFWVPLEHTREYGASGFDSGVATVRQWFHRYGQIWDTKWILEYGDVEVCGGRWLIEMFTISTLAGVGLLLTKKNAGRPD